MFRRLRQFFSLLKQNTAKGVQNLMNFKAYVDNNLNVVCLFLTFTKAIYSKDENKVSDMHFGIMQQYSRQLTSYILTCYFDK